MEEITPTEITDAPGQDSYSSLREKNLNKILTDLSYRGKLADKMLEADMAGDIVDLSKIKTYSEARELLIIWISNNPDKAVEYDLKLSGKTAYDPLELYGGDLGDVRVNDDGSITRTIYKYSLSDGFLAKIKELNEAATNKNLSVENLYESSRKLFEGSSPYTGTIHVDGLDNASSVYSGEKGFKSKEYTGKYDDIKINKTALAKEFSIAGNLLDSLRGDGKGPSGAEIYYSNAQKAYSNFSAVALSLKSRKVINQPEAENLEKHRTALRKSLAGLSLFLMSIYTENMSHSLTDERADGYNAMRKSLRKLLENLDEKLMSAGETANDINAITKIVNEAHAEFLKIYMSYSVYVATLSMEEQIYGIEFSCLYDYLSSAWLKKYFPGSPVVVLRENINNMKKDISNILALVADGNVKEALKDGKLDTIDRDIRLAKKYSLYNKAIQFYNWGILFRPITLQVSVANGKARFVPEFTYFDIKQKLQYADSPTKVNN